MRTILFNTLVARLFSAQLNAVFDQGYHYGVAVSTYQQNGDAMKAKGCSALQMSDQMVCNKCNLRWDMNDPEPPLCRAVHTDPPIQSKGSDGKSESRFYHAFKNNLMLMKQRLEDSK